jgi:hypothetical protein
LNLPFCDAIKKFKPSKIVEVGIVGGRTTTNIMKCLVMLHYEDCEIISIDDYAERFYRDETVPTGYLGVKALEMMPKMKNKHKFLLGDIDYGGFWN